MEKGREKKRGKMISKGKDKEEEGKGGRGKKGKEKWKGKGKVKERELKKSWTHGRTHGHSGDFILFNAMH